MDINRHVEFGRPLPDRSEPLIVVKNAAGHAVDHCALEAKLGDSALRPPRRILAAVPLDRLSEKSRELIVTEKRALGENVDRGIRFSGPSWIGSPMEAEAMARPKIATF
jgi:hypothetical protein